MIPHLKDIGTGLTNCLQQYYSDAELVADWDCTDTISVNFPIPRISIGHREIGTGIDFVGHGLQRAVLFAIMQYLAESQPREAPVEATYEEPQSDIILLIEEPEIYQHPIKQSLIYDALTKIADGFNAKTGIRFQIIYTTHSEKLIDIRSFGGVRIIRKNDGSPSPLQTSCCSYSIDECRYEMARIIGETTPMSTEAFTAKLHIMTKEISEGFFANKVIFVEGVTDRAVLEAAFLSKNRCHRREGISILSADGKTKIDKLALIFIKLSIPTYIVVDNDSPDRKAIACNKTLRTIAGLDTLNEFPEGVFDRIAFFPGKLEKYLEGAIGNRFCDYREEIANQFGLTQKEVSKTPEALKRLFLNARSDNVNLSMIDQIIVNIDLMR